jgi:hypothetical protein
MVYEVFDVCITHIPACFVVAYGLLISSGDSCEYKKVNVGYDSAG